MGLDDLRKFAAEVVDYEKKFTEARAKMAGLECEIAARGYEVEAMYQSLLEQEKVHIETIELLQQIINHIPMPIFWKDKDRVCLGCNIACERALGLSRENIVGKTVFDMFDKQYAEIYDQADTQTFANGKYTYIGEFKRLDGSVVNAVFHMCAYYTIVGEEAGIIVFAHTPCDGRLCP